MRTVAPITEQFQHFLRDLKESFWGDLYGQARGTLEKFLNQESARLRDEWAYLFVDGVSLRVRRPSGRKRVQMLVAYGVRMDGSRRLLAFLRSQGESQAAWESLLQDLYRRGLEGQNLLLIITDGCAGLAAAIQTVYPRVPHQRCWVHMMRNICEAVRRRDHDQVKQGAQKIYQAASRAEAERAFLRFKWNWQRAYPGMVR